MKITYISPLISAKLVNFLVAMTNFPMIVDKVPLTSCYNSRYFVLSQFDFDVIHFSKFFIGFVSLSTGKMIPVLARAMKRISENLSMLFL
jgi:hypothetical protein